MKMIGSKCGSSELQIQINEIYLVQMPNIESQNVQIVQCTVGMKKFSRSTWKNKWPGSGKTGYPVISNLVICFRYCTLTIKKMLLLFDCHK